MENKFLRDKGFVNDDLRLINKDGDLIDIDDNLINEDGNLVKIVKGKKVIVDEKGEVLETTKTGPAVYLDEDDKPILEKKIKKNSKKKTEVVAVK